MDKVESAYKTFHQNRLLRLAAAVEKRVTKIVEDGFEASPSIVRGGIEAEEFREEAVFAAGWEAGRAELLELVKDMYEDWKSEYKIQETGVLLERVQDTLKERKNVTR